MKLTSFSVSNFRSITTAKKVPLNDYSVLIGANNEGKSNILHALAIGMEALERFQYTVHRDRLGRVVRSTPSTLLGRVRYNWAVDFPIAKQKSNSKPGCTEIILEFDLSENEISEFFRDIGSKVNGTLPILIKIYKDDIEVSVAKPGPGGINLTKKANRVADFVSRRVNFEYIPAIRTSEAAEDVIYELVSKELSRLESDNSYRDAINKIEEIQAPILESLSKSIRETVSSFLPSVKDVSVRLPRDARVRALRRGIAIEVDDGNRTPLERKGDGVKSLVALALMRHASTLSVGTNATVVAIEEPEAHLHPQAIHELREVLLGLSKKSQVIITSHSPLFVNPSSLTSTIVVQGNKAGPAKDIEEVRGVLGVRLSDNLQSARLVAIVEGDDDVILLKAIIKNRFQTVWNSINEGDLVFDSLGGASNLSYKVRTYRTSASMVQCFLDDDSAGRSAVSKAQKESVIKISDYNLFTVPGLQESELEDLLDVQIYKYEFRKEFGVDPTIKPPTARGKKWSDAMEKKFSAHGKIWHAMEEIKVKIWLAKFAENNIDKIIIEDRFAPINAFIESIKIKLQI